MNNIPDVPPPCYDEDDHDEFLKLKENAPGINPPQEQPTHPLADTFDPNKNYKCKSVEHSYELKNGEFYPSLSWVRSNEVLAFCTVDTWNTLLFKETVTRVSDSREDSWNETYEILGIGLGEKIQKSSKNWGSGYDRLVIYEDRSGDSAGPSASTARTRNLTQPNFPTISLDPTKKYLAKAVDSTLHLSNTLPPNEFYPSLEWVRNNKNIAAAPAKDYSILVFKEHLSQVTDNSERAWNDVYQISGRELGNRIEKSEEDWASTACPRLVIYEDPNGPNPGSIYIPDIGVRVADPGLATATASETNGLEWIRSRNKYVRIFLNILGFILAYIFVKFFIL